MILMIISVMVMMTDPVGYSGSYPTPLPSGHLWIEVQLGLIDRGRGHQPDILYAPWKATYIRQEDIFLKSNDDDDRSLLIDTHICATYRPPVGDILSFEKPCHDSCDDDFEDLPHYHTTPPPKATTMMMKVIKAMIINGRPHEGIWRFFAPSTVHTNALSKSKTVSDVRCWAWEDHHRLFTQLSAILFIRPSNYHPKNCSKRSWLRSLPQCDLLYLPPEI